MPVVPALGEDKTAVVTLKERYHSPEYVQVIIEFDSSCVKGTDEEITTEVEGCYR